MLYVKRFTWLVILTLGLSWFFTVELLSATLKKAVLNMVNVLLLLFWKDELNTFPTERVYVQVC